MKNASMKGLFTGLGIVIGASLGILFGLFVLSAWPWAPLVGAALGLVIGSALDAHGISGWRTR